MDDLDEEAVAQHRNVCAHRRAPAASGKDASNYFNPPTLHRIRIQLQYYTSITLPSVFHLSSDATFRLRSRAFLDARFSDKIAYFTLS